MTNRGRTVRWWLAFMLFCLPFVTARADVGPIVPVRVGSHPGFGRVVFDLPARFDYQMTQQGDRVLVRFTGDVTIGAGSAVPRNVLGLFGGLSQAELIVAPGTVIRDSRIGDRVVIDVLDPGTALDAPPGTSQGQPRTPQPGVAKRATPAPMPLVKPSAVSGTQEPAADPTIAASPSARAAAVVSPPAVAPATAATALPTAAKQPSVQPGLPSPGATESAGPTERITPPKQTTQPERPTPPEQTAKSEQTAKPEQTAQPQPLTAPKATDEPAPKATATDTVAQALPSPSAPPAAEPIVTAGANPTTVTPTNANPMLVVPFETPLGVAAFRRGNAALIVFDQRRSIDLTSLQDDPVFGTATVETLPTATVIRLRLDPEMALSLSLSRRAWRIAAIPALPILRPVGVAATDGRVVLSAASPGDVVSLLDPESGAMLLVGTQRQPGQGIAAHRRAVEFSLLPTWQGIAVEPTTDRLTLRPTQQGFLLTGGADGLAISPPTDAAELLAHAAGLTRQFDFADLPAEALTQRLRRQVNEDAETPALSRGPPRKAVAHTMISLGLGAEAQALLAMAVADDPRLAAAADTSALTSIAAILAHRPAEAQGLGDQRFAGADDIALWRALRLAQLQSGSPQAAQVMAATVPLLLTYPTELRNRLLPLAAETLVLGGETDAAWALLDQRKNDASLDLARGMLKEAQGDGAAALAIYDRVAQSRDQWVHARAAARAAEMRLASGAIDAAKTAEELDKLLYAWRGDQYERALRSRVAGIKAQSGAWRSALSLLRETEMVFPSDKIAVHAELIALFATLLHEDTADTLAPLELAALAEENADLLPDGAEGEALQARLADRLMALELPKRAGPVIEKLMRAAPTATGRAGFGLRLATLRLGESDPSGALAALAASGSDNLPSDLAEQRTLLFAAATSRRGESDRALAALSALGTAAADEARATILERAGDWPAAQSALSKYVAKSIPAEGKLNDAQRRTLLRLATAAARAGDQVTLTTLRQQQSVRMEAGPLADMFRLLTADQVLGVGDLKRAGQETALARGLPAQLKALQPPPPQVQ